MQSVQNYDYLQYTFTYSRTSSIKYGDINQLLESQDKLKLLNITWTSIHLQVLNHITKNPCKMVQEKEIQYHLMFIVLKLLVFDLLS